MACTIHSSRQALARPSPGPRQALVVPALLEERDGPPGALDQLLLGAPALGHEVHLPADQVGGRLELPERQAAGRLPGSGERPVGQEELPDLDLGLPGVELQPGSLRVVAREQYPAALEQVGGGVHVAPRQGPLPGRREVPGAAEPDLHGVFVERAELGQRQVRLLEVVAADLGELQGPVGVHALGPVDEALVDLRSRPLEHPVVRRLPDQDVQGHERVLARDERLGGGDELLPGEARERPVHPVPHLLRQCSGVHRTGSRPFHTRPGTLICTPPGKTMVGVRLKLACTSSLVQAMDACHARPVPPSAICWR